METGLIKAKDGELQKDGTFVVERTENGDSITEKVRYGLLKIRGEREPRKISYGDYLTLKSFYVTQAKLISERKNILVELSDGSAVNTADITSLDVAETNKVTKKALTTDQERLRNLPTEWLVLDENMKMVQDTYGKPIGSLKALKMPNNGIYLHAKCHYVTRNDEKQYIISKRELIPEIFTVRFDNDGYMLLTNHEKYGMVTPPFC